MPPQHRDHRSSGSPPAPDAPAPAPRTAVVDIGLRGLRLTVADPAGRWFRPVAHRTVALPLWRALLADRREAVGAAELGAETAPRLVHVATRSAPARTVLVARSRLAGRSEAGRLLDRVAAATRLVPECLRPPQEARLAVAAVAAGAPGDGFVLACEADGGTVRVGVVVAAGVVWATAVSHPPHGHGRDGGSCALAHELLPWASMAPPHLALAGGEPDRSAAGACIAASVDVARTCHRPQGLHAGIVIAAIRAAGRPLGHRERPVPSWHVQRVPAAPGAPAP